MENSKQVGSLKESTYATMHRQPTAATVAAADTKASERAQAALEEARALHAENKDAECLKALEPVDLP